MLYFDQGSVQTTLDPVRVLRYDDRDRFTHHTDPSAGSGILFLHNTNKILELDADIDIDTHCKLSLWRDDAVKLKSNQ